MKLNIVPARTGLQWVKLGARTFLRQPLAMAGLFFMFMASVSVLSLVPVIGTLISLALVPAATLGLMAATREAQEGRFPMPTTLVTAFRGGAARTRAMLVLGALYAAGLMLVFGVGALFGTEAAPVVDAAGSTEVTPEMVREMFSRQGLWASMLLYVPLLMAFWHAPALVYWQGVSPVKSLFFSLLACWSNKGAMVIYTLGWIAVFMLVGVLMSLLGALLGGGGALNLVLYPMVLLLASAFHASIWFSVRDSFVFTQEDPAA
ncbi:BPSS1780 family membrane protein [Hydrogenophaga palleronii]|uniref:BPSS1780 family membrane protein n=1 Tax=Hydrogenophaga palleronii TaxID=65655 RepID=UPI000824D14E|nr:BPSS1780 family membrane protein [Hydrogenophaga palleronii]